MCVCASLSKIQCPKLPHISKHLKGMRNEVKRPFLVNVCVYAVCVCAYSTRALEYWEKRVEKPLLPIRVLIVGVIMFFIPLMLAPLLLIMFLLFWWFFVFFLRVGLFLSSRLDCHYLSWTHYSRLYNLWSVCSGLNLSFMKTFLDFLKHQTFLRVLLLHMNTRKAHDWNVKN